MASDFSAKVTGAAIHGSVCSVFSAPYGAYFGYLYARLVDLPASQVAKAWAIWSVADSMLLSISNVFVQNHYHRRFYHGAIYINSTAWGILALQSFGLVNEKMMKTIAIMKTMTFLVAFGITKLIQGKVSNNGVVLAQF